jgi:hypothetical protein
MHDVADAMARAQVGAADHTVKQIDLDDPNAILLRINTEAVDYAASRAAEMVGKRYDTDGNLIDNPDADWAITDTARNVLRREIRDSLATDRDVDRLADHITDTGIFSDDRAEMIARTETNMAMNQGVLEAGRQARDAGLNVRKAWTLGPNPCELCQDAAAEGDIDLDDDFGSDAGDAPPLHPNCECSLDLVVANEEEEEEDKMQNLKAATRKRFERIFKNDTADDADADHVVSQIADLLVEAADGEVSRQAAMHWLLNTPGGRALIGHLSRLKRATNKGKAFTMNRSEHLAAVVRKAGGVDGLAKRFVRDGTSGDISEAEWTGMLTATAKALYPELDDARAFAKLYTGPNGETLRRATQVAMFTQLYGGR